MARFSFTRLFSLEMASAIGSKRRNIKPGRVSSGLSIKIPQEYDAVALRWRLAPYLGIPKEPFKVWRRLSDNEKLYKALGITKRTISNNNISLNGESFYDIIFVANNAFSNDATVFAIDQNGEPIPGESVKIPPGANSSIRFKAPNIGSIGVTNACELSFWRGVSMQAMINANDWQLIEIVGLPYARDEVPSNIYDSTIEQGRVGQLTDGRDACDIRVEVARLFYQDPDTNAFGVNVPAIKAPTGSEILNEITDGGDNLLSLLTEMFENTNQGSFNPKNRQSEYSKSLKRRGIHQPSSSVSSEDSEFKIPVAATTLLSASMDIWACLGLGFGTTDIIDSNDFLHTKYTEPRRSFRSPYDYMVSSQFILPGNIRREYAALSRYNIVPDALQTPLFVNNYSKNRPLSRDAAFSEDLNLRWLRIPTKYLPVSYIFARSDDGSSAKILSEKRPFTSSGYYGFIPAKNPNQDVIHEISANYIDRLNKNPFIGSRTVKYLKIATDIFGRWSNWVEANYNLPSTGPHMPAILNTEFKLDLASAVGKSAPASLEIEVAWDWEDRSPSTIEIVGKFFNPSSSPGAIAPPGLQKINGLGFGTSVKLTFNNSGINQIPTTITGVTVKKKAPEASDGQTRKYLVSVKGMRVDFTTVDRVAYAVFARASEKVNAALLSNYSPPKTTKVNNPFPAAIPSVLPDIYWTSLPDATGYARYELNFPNVPGAQGYVIYEATELGLRDALGLPELLTTDIIARANDLLGNANNPRAKDAFIRKNRDILPAPRTTVNLPAVASGFYIYCITSITSEQIESEMSGWLIVAVSQRMIPAPPILEVNPVAGGLQVEIEPYGNLVSRSIELYRTRSELLVTNINIMGNPVAYDSDPRWEKLDAGRNPMTSSDDVPNYYRLLDNAEPSWLPYYYRAAAFGEHDPVNGLIKGRSKSSNLVKVSLLPPDPPDLINLTVAKTGSHLRLRFESRAERWISPLGVHKLRVLTVDRTATEFNEVQILETTLALIEMKTSSGITLLEFYRTSIDNERRWTYEGYIPSTTHEIILRLIDPKGRISELRTTYIAPPVRPKVDIVSLIAKQNSKRLLVQFKSGTPITKPLRGVYLMEIFFVQSRTTKLLIKKEVHLIPEKRMGLTPDLGVNITPLIDSGLNLGARISVSDRINPLTPRPIKMTIYRSVSRDGKGRYTYLITIPAKSVPSTLGLIKKRVIVRISGPKRKVVKKEKNITEG